MKRVLRIISRAISAITALACSVWGIQAIGASLNFMSPPDIPYFVLGLVLMTAALRALPDALGAEG